MKEEDYNNLEEVIEDMRQRSTGSTEYAILRGLVYDTLRYQEKEFPNPEAGEIVRMLGEADYDGAEESIEKYLELGEVEIAEEV